MKSDYFIIGSHFELSAKMNSVKERSSHFPCRFAVSRCRNVRGHVEAHQQDGYIHMTLQDGDDFSGKEAGEIYRLFSRVCVRLGQHQVPLKVKCPQKTEDELTLALAADGFKEGAPGEWIRPPQPFTLPPEEKGDHMDDVYRDPLYIPWNFVPREWDVLEALLPAETALRVLDLGCGFGKNATLLEERGFQVHGIDIASAAVRRCRELVDVPDRFVVGSATALPWDNGSFDQVLDVGCIHCLPREYIEPALAEIARVLAPGGVLISRVFKPRSPAWLDAQPFRTAEFGFGTDVIVALYRRYFHVEIYRQDEDATYLLAGAIGGV